LVASYCFGHAVYIGSVFAPSYLHFISRFLYSVLPPGDEDLKGDEVQTIIKFKNALGLDDVDAANMHMEIGRRIYRERLETRDRDADMEQRRVRFCAVIHKWMFKTFYCP
jgi:hypothetical protein